MPRNTGGVYSLPNPPFVSGTVISSTVMNQQLSDLASAMTESLSRSGNGDMQVPLTGPDGSAALPTYAWGSDPGTGFWLPSIGMVRLTSSAATLQQWTTTGVTINPALTVTGGITGGLAVTGNLSATGNTTLGDAVGDTTTISGPTTVGAALTATGAVTSNAGGEDFLAKPGSADHAYLGFYARTATPTTRTGFVGFGSAAATNLVLGNLIAGGNINIIPGTGAQILVEGVVRFNSVANPASSTAFTNAVTPANITKVIAEISHDGAGNVSIVGGFNITSVALVASVADGLTVVRVTFASAFASTVYFPQPTVSRALPFQYRYQAGARTTTTTEIRMVDAAGAHANPTTTAGTFVLSVYGAQ